MRNKLHPNVGRAGNLSTRRAGSCVPLRLPSAPLKGEAVVGKGLRYVMKLESQFLHFLALRHSPSNSSQSSVRPQSPAQQSELTR